jgi:hypothetical protein
MVVVELLEGTQLVHYLLRRQRIERDGRMEAHDELDWVGHYIAEGLYFDPYFKGDEGPQRFRLLSYTEPIDAWYFTKAGVRTIAAPKPTHQIPPNLERFIQRLETERPAHWIAAGCALLDGDQESRDMWDAAIVHAGERLQREGWSNASQIFAGRLGVTLYVDFRTPWPDIAEKVSDYCRTKAQEQGNLDWIGIGEGATGSLFVLLVEPLEDPASQSCFWTPRWPHRQTQTDSYEPGSTIRWPRVLRNRGGDWRPIGDPLAGQ